jgi:hypothetical protein
MYKIENDTLYGKGQQYVSHRKRQRQESGSIKVALNEINQIKTKEIDIRGNIILAVIVIGLPAAFFQLKYE